MRNCGRVRCIAIEQMVVCDPGFANQLFEQHLAEAAGMGDRQSYVFVEVEGFHLAPIDAAAACECIQKFDLRGGCSRNDPGASLLEDRALNRAGGLKGGGPAQRIPILENLEEHDFSSCKLRKKRLAIISRQDIGALMPSVRAIPLSIVLRRSVLLPAAA